MPAARSWRSIRSGPGSARTSSTSADAKRPSPSIPVNRLLMPPSWESWTSGTCLERLRNRAPDMQIGRVVGTIVATQKNRKLEGAKLLLVQPMTLEGAARGAAVLAIDSVGAGIGERVLLVVEGKAAGDALGKKGAAVDAAIIGIVDEVDYRDE